MKLIGSTTSPYVRKVRVVMAEKKLEYAFVLDNVWEPSTCIARSNPLGKVPCLVMESGEVIYDSRVIVDYLDTLSPVGRLIPPPGRHRAEVKTWEALADGILDAAILVRLENTFAGRTPEQRCAAWIERQMDKVHAGLAVLGSGLAEKPFFCGNHLSLADIAVVCALGWLEFRFPEIDWRAQYPNLGRLHDKLVQRPSFQNTRPEPMPS